MAQNPFLSLFGRGQADPSVMMQQLAGNDFASQLLSHYGLSIPQIGRNVVLPNDGFFGRHPRLSTGIENALIAAANTPTGATIGENIGNVARGLLSVQPTRDAMQMSKLMAPFGMAQQFQQLETGQENLNLMKAHENYYNRYADGMLNDSSLPYHSVHVGRDGNLWGISKTTRRLEKIPAEQEGLFQVPGSGMGFSEELAKGRRGLLEAQGKMSPEERKASIAGYEGMWQDQMSLAGGKAGAAWGAQHSQPGAMTPSDQTAFEVAKRDAAVGSLDYLTSHALDPNPVPFDQFHKNAVDRMEQLVPGSSGERGPAPASPMPRGKKGTSAAAPPPASNDIFSQVVDAMNTAARAKEAATNPKRFAPTPGHGASSDWEPESRASMIGRTLFNKFFHPGNGR